MECALGVLKEKFPCLNHLRLNPTYACRVVSCCVALCNLSKNDSNPLRNDDDEINNMENESVDHENNHNIDAQEKLQYYYNHFH